MSKLPFRMSAELKSSSTIIVRAGVNGKDITSERLQLGNGNQRRKLAELWASDARLWSDTRPDIGEVVAELERVESDVQLAIEAAEALDDDDEATSGGGDGKKKDSQAFILTKLCLASGAELWHSRDGDCFATTPISGHSEHWPVRSRQFKRWLSGLFFFNYQRGPSSQAMQDAISTIESIAHFKGKEYTVATRVAEHDGAIYIDLADDAWRAIRVTPNGWTVLVNDPPVKFRRARGMLALPVPVAGGSLEELRPFLNVASDTDWKLIVSFLLGAFNPRGPYPVLPLNGEQGSAKSTQSRILRSLIDPNTAALRAMPRDERDLVIACNNGWIIALDNLSSVPDWLSDALCRIATGGGFGTRELYTDGDEVIFSAQRPILLNGITELATRSDLLDRAIVVTLPTIPENKRRTEVELSRAFEAARPRILGALLDAVSCAMRNIESVSLDRHPRMADFARWIVAAEPACPWTPGAFLAAYTGNRAQAHELAIEASVIGAAVRSLVESVGVWNGAASELLELLNSRLPRTGSGSAVYPPGWPKRPDKLSGHLKRIAPNLRETGIAVTFTRSRAGRRVQLEKVGEVASPASPASPTLFSEPETPIIGDATPPSGDASSVTRPQVASRENRTGAIENGDVGATPPSGDASSVTRPQVASRENRTGAIENGDVDASDAGDASFPLLSSLDDAPVDADLADAVAAVLDDRQPVPDEVNL